MKLTIPNYVLGILLLVCLGACKKNSNTLAPIPPVTADTFMRAVDLSFLPEIEQANIPFFTAAGQQRDVLAIIKDAGVNTVRVRLWHAPATEHSSLAEVQQFCARLQSLDLKVWLDIHYSDTWADPGNQSLPVAWENLSTQLLEDSVYDYTKQVVALIKPAYVQVGNEINGGFLWEPGRISNREGFLRLLRGGIRGAREGNSTTVVMLHHAGLDADWLFGLMKQNQVDYDMVALSYYPVWHGKDLATVGSTITRLRTLTGKPVIIAETAYPFTFDFNDYTNNIIGTADQLIPAYPATADGQKSYLQNLRTVIQQAQGSGFCYWGAEWVAFKGPTAANGSSWENQSLFDFNKKALPALEVFKK